MKWRGVPGVLAVAAIAAAPFWLSEYHLALLTYVGISAVVALGLVLLTGKAGLSSFGQAAFVGIGAYVSAVLTLRTGISPWASLPVSLVAAGGCAWLGALVVVRLSGHYLSLATIAFGVAMVSLFGGLAVTGGQNGLAGIAPLSIEGFVFGPAANYALVWAVVLAVMLMASNLLDSRMGRAIRALKDGEMMAEAMGVDTAAAKAAVFVIACVLAGFAGWFYAHFQRFVNPTAFSLGQGIEYLFMAVLGGAGLLWGAVIGAGVITLIKPVLQAHLPGLLGVTGNFEGVVFGGLVILLFQFAAEGLLPRVRMVLGWPEIVARTRAPGAALPRVAGPGTAVLSVVGARKAFGGVLANADVSLELRGGEILALIGPNGAGKSTFFDLVTGATRPDGGVFLLDGESIAGLSPRAIARLGVGRSFQHVRLIADMSVLENVAVGAHRRGRGSMLAAMLRLDRREEAALLAEAWLQLERVGLAEAAWQPAGSLALGQQRVVELARALAGDPRLLLLDEPAAGLRLQEKQALAGLIRGLVDAGLAVLLVEHDMDFVMSLADRVVVMEFGRVISAGTPGEVQRDKLVQDAYLGVEA